MQNNTIQKKPEYALIYFIHGDSDYLFHKNGKAHKADKEALKEAFDVALQAESGEVFIFHQKPEKKAFLLFPKKDRRFYHYRNGELVRLINYSPENGGLDKEVALINEHISSEVKRTALFYFGHEIPASEYASYHKSQAESIFNIEVFADNLELLPGTLDILALSTCNNGTPEVVSKLIDRTEALVASPQNLHLSYLNTRKVLLLEQNTSMPSFALADSIASHSFEKLRSFVETEITISVYDLNRVSNYVDELTAAYSHQNKPYLTESFNGDNKDCKDITASKSEISTEGVRTYYSPSMFGRSPAKTFHSGWGCKP